MAKNFMIYQCILYKKNIIIGSLEFNPIVFYISAFAVLLLLILLLYIYKVKGKSKVSPKPETDATISKTKGPLSSDDEYNTTPTYQVGKLHNIGKRKSQQDSFAVSDTGEELCSKKGLFAIVADGMGGLSDGDKVSSMVTLSFFRDFHETEFSNPADALLTMLQHANDEVNNFLGNKITQSGSTLVAGIIKDYKLYWISVGDSHIYHYRNGNLMQLNREHTYRHELDAKAANGEISRETALNDPQRNALTSYIGMGRLEQIDRNVTPLNLCKGDRILFMSDGVFGTLGDEAIAQAMSMPVEESINIMDDWIKATNKSNQDNYTAVILQC